MIENSGASSSPNVITANFTQLDNRLTSDYTWWSIRIEDVNFSNNSKDYIKIDFGGIPMAFSDPLFEGRVLPYENTTKIRYFSGSNVDYYYTDLNTDVKSRIPCSIVSGAIDYDVLANDTIYYFSDSDNNGLKHLVFSASLLPISSEDSLIVVYSDYDD